MVVYFNEIFVYNRDKNEYEEHLGESLELKNIINLKEYAFMQTTFSFLCIRLTCTCTGLKVALKLMKKMSKLSNYGQRQRVYK